MAITLNDLTVNFSHLKREVILEDWRWLTGPDKQPILISAIGDAFVQDPGDGTVHLMDAGSGELSQVADSAAEFEELVADREFVTDTMLPGLIVELRKAGKTLEPGQVYSFKNPPVLGGEYEVDNFEPMDIEVHFSIFGQIHRQVKDLPPGTPITGMKLVEA